MTTRIFLLLLATMTATACGQWQHFQQEDTDGLAGNEIQYLGRSPRGGIWIGTLTGASYYNAGKFDLVIGSTKKSGKLNTWSILELADGTVHIGTHNGVMKISGDTRTMSFVKHTIAPIVQVKDGELWAIAKDMTTELNKLIVYDGKEWQLKSDAQKLHAVDIFKDSRGYLWITLDGNGVLEVDPGKGITDAVHHMQGMNVTTVAEDSSHRAWCGFWGRGVAVREGEKWEHHLKKLKGSAVMAIVEDTADTIWVATSAHGLFRRQMSKQTWINDLAEEGSINLLVATGDGRVWISSQMVGGLRAWTDDGWTVALDSPLPTRCFLETTKAYWAGGVLDGVYRAGR